MPLPRFQNLPAPRRAAVLTAAAEEFAGAGFEGASYNRIIARAGVSKGAMYYYFHDKADLYATVVEDAAARIAEAAGDLGAPRDAEAFWAELAGLLERAGAFLVREPEVVELVRGLYQRAGATQTPEALSAIVERSRGWFGRLLEQGRALGAVRGDVPPELLTHAFMGMCLWMDRWFAENWDAIEPEALPGLSQSAMALCRSLAAPPTEEKP